MAFRPVDNVKDFINKYVLSEKEIDINAMKESIDRLSEFEQTLKNARNERDELEHIITRFDEIEKNSHDQRVNDILLRIIDRDSLKKASEDLQASINILRHKIKSIADRKEETDIRLNDIKKRLMDLNQTYLNSDYNRLTEKLESSLSELKKDRSYHERRQAELIEKVKSLIKCLDILNKDTSVPFSQDELRMLNDVEDENNKAEIVQKIDDFLLNAIEIIREKKYRVKVQYDEMTAQIADLEQQIKSLESQTIAYPEAAEHLRSVIAEEFKRQSIDSSVYILAELLTITDKQWTNAIEGYLNTQRFYLVVDPEYYPLALDIYNANKQSYNQGIINFRRLPQNVASKPNSLAALVETQNRYARRYIDYILGNVICCESVSELENHDAAITKSCMVYKNYVSRKIDPKIYGKPYIGKDAIEVQLRNVRQHFKKLKEDLPALRQNIDLYTEIDKAYGRVNIEIIRQNADAPNRLVSILKKITEETEELEHIKKDPNIIELQIRIKQTEDEERQQSRERDNLISEYRSFSDSIDRETTKMNEIEQQLKIKTDELNKENDANVGIFAEASEKYENLIKTRSLQEAKDNYTRQKSVYDNKANRLLNGEKHFIGLYQMQSQYNSVYGKDFLCGTESYAQYKTLFDKLNGVQIAYYEETVRKARDKCEEIFRNDFLSKMKESIESAKYEFDNLKKALKDISYGEDTYKFVISANNNKKNLYDMIMADDNYGTNTIFGGEFENKYKEELDELFTKIKSGDSGEQAVREYTDYRTYLDYDIEIRKKNGTVQKLSSKAKSSSGGESQVPFYVIMAASLHNIYRQSNSVRLLLLDEAFNNMDEQRISSVMRFFNELNFQTILVAPTPKIQDIEENVDSVITVMREDTVSFAEDFRYYGD